MERQVHAQAHVCARLEMAHGGHQKHGLKKMKSTERERNPVHVHVPARAPGHKHGPVRIERWPYEQFQRGLARGLEIWTAHTRSWRVEYGVCAHHHVEKGRDVAQKKS